MEKVIIRNRSNYKIGKSEKDIEENSGGNIAVPNLSYSIKEVLEKAKRGVIDISVLQRKVVYDSDRLSDEQLEKTDEVGYITGDEDLSDIQEVEQFSEKIQKKPNGVRKKEEGSGEDKPKTGT